MRTDFILAVLRAQQQKDVRQCVSVHSWIRTLLVGSVFSAERREASPTPAFGQKLLVISHVVPTCCALEEEEGEEEEIWTWLGPVSTRGF